MKITRATLASLAKAGFVAVCCTLIVLMVTGCGQEATPTLPPATSWLSAAQTITPVSAAPAPSNATAAPTPTDAGPTLTPSPTARPWPTDTAVPTKPSEPVAFATIALGDLPAAGHVPSGVVALDGRVYVANRGSNNVSVIEGDAVRYVVPVGAQPCALAADAASGRVFVANEGDKTISVIEKLAVADTWALPDTPGALAVIGGQLWVGMRDVGSIRVLSAANGSRVGEIALPDALTVLAIEQHAATKRVYVATYNHTWLLNADSLQVMADVSLNSYRALGVAANGDAVYTDDYNGQEMRPYLAVLDPVTLAVRERIPAPADPAAILADPQSGKLYVISVYGNLTAVYDGATHQQAAAIPVGNAPRYAALDAQAGRLYVANQEDDSISVIDLASNTVAATIPLMLRLKSMDVDPINGRLYVAIGSADQVAVVEAGRVAMTWSVGRYPNWVRAAPSAGQVAVLSRADARLTLLDQAGQAVASHPVGTDPKGILVDDFQRRIIAGDLLVELDRGVTRTLRIPALSQTEVPPVRMVLDTRRNALYAVAFNGIPGSNGGYVVTRLGDLDADKPTPVSIEQSVVDLVYDEEMDRFYSTHTRMGTYGLQVVNAENAQEVMDIVFQRYPMAMALNPATRHLWVVLGPPTWQAGDDMETEVIAFDTTAMAQVASFKLQGWVESLAVDLRSSSVFVGNSYAGAIQIIQDVALPAPATVAATPTPPPAQAKVSAQATPTPAPTCAFQVDARLLPAWQAAGGVGGLGCAWAEAEEGDWAWQPFQRGEMFWIGTTGTIFALRENGSYATYHDDWKEGAPSISCEATPPADLQQPVRGFGLVWCRESGVREDFGWAALPEQAFHGVYQTFAGGALLLDNSGAVRALRSNGKWERLAP